MEDTHEYLTREDLAKYVRMSTRWVTQQLASETPPPSMRVGAKWLFKKQEIDTWMTQKFTPPATPS